MRDNSFVVVVIILALLYILIPVRDSVWNLI